MAQSDASQRTAGRKKGRNGWIVAVAVLVLLVVAGVVGARVLQDRPVSAGEWLTERVEAQVNSYLPNGEITFRDIQMGLSAEFRPQIYLSGVQLIDQAGLPLADLRRLQGDIALNSLLRGEVELRRLAASGAVIRLDRRSDGSFDLGFGAGAVGEAVSLATLLTDVDAFFERGAVSAIEKVQVDAVTINYVDALSGQTWTGDGGSLTVVQDSDQLLLTSQVAVLTGRQDLAAVELTYDRDRNTGTGQVSAVIEDAVAADIASQSTGLSWLSVVDASLSGSLRAEVSPAGLGPLYATLDLSEGALQPTLRTRPVAFNQASIQVSFDPEAQRLSFEELSVDSDWGQTTAGGTATFTAFDGALPEEIVGQFQIQELVANPADLFETPQAIDAGDVDFRITLRPFQIEVGRAVVQAGDTNATVQGTIAGGAEGWDLSMDAQIDRIEPQTLMAFWPLTAAPGVRDWMNRNLRGGQMRNAAVALRAPPGERPDIALTHVFEYATVRVMQTLPVVENARGAVQIARDTTVILIDEGEMTAPEGGIVRADNSRFVISNMRKKPSDGQLTLNAEGPITAVLSLLNLRPFEFMTRANLPVALSDGSAQVGVTVGLPLKKGIRGSEVSFGFEGMLSNVDTSVLIPGRRLTADRLKVSGDRSGLQIAGAGVLDGVPFNGRWQQPLGQPGVGSTVKGTVQISSGALDAFGIDLPPGTVSGTGQGALTLRLQPNVPPTFELTSNLAGVAFSIPPVGWSKSADSSGDFAVSGALGANPSVDRLSISAPGFQAEGRLRLGEGGAFQAAELSRVRVGDWLDAPVTLTNRGAGLAPDISLASGRLDLRNATFGDGADDPSGAGGPVEVRLDSLQITRDIALQQFEASLDTEGGVRGTFEGRVNGGARVTGRISPGENGPIIRLRARNAGNAIRDAGFLRNVVGGDLQLTLTSRAQVGQYDGVLDLDNIRVRDMPAMAELINAISVVGLLQQLDGNGLAFTDADATFRITPGQVIVSESSAVGPSLGVSLDGVYALDSNQMDFQGVVSPLYLLNGVGSFLTRRGEGFIGFNFTLQGTANDPKANVNPLSALTPGMFREIFRRPAPDLGQ